MSSSSSLCFSIFTTNNSINTIYARSSSSRSKLFGVSPSSCLRRKKEHFVDAERRRRLVKNSSHRQQHLLYKEEDNTEEEKGKPVDFYDEIIARNERRSEGSGGAIQNENPTQNGVGRKNKEKENALPPSNRNAFRKQDSKSKSQALLHLANQHRSLIAIFPGSLDFTG